MGESGRRKHYKGGETMFLNQIRGKTEIQNVRNLKVVVGKSASLITFEIYRGNESVVQ